MSRSPKAPILVALALLSLGIACFGRLALDPTGLIVDADRPSVDHASTRPDPVAGNDATRLFLPHHLGIADQFASLGRVPTWDDRGFGGRPLVGNPQGGLFYPPTWIAWATGVPSALGWITFGHLLFAGWGTYRLARTLGLGVMAALVAAGCFQANPYVLAQVFEGHYPHVWAAAWTPWAFDAMVRGRRGDRRATLLLAPILAATFLAGHPQEGYYLALVLGAWAAWDAAVATRRGDRRRVGRVGLAGLGIGLLTLGLIAVEVIPDALASPWGLRWGRLPLRLAGQYHPDPINAIQLLSPRALGGPADYFGHDNYWETLLSIGLIPLLLAAIGATQHPDRRGVRGWLVLVALTVVFASGRKLGLFALLYEAVPGMDRFRVPARSLFLASLGGAILAGCGVDALRLADRSGWPRLARRLGLLGLVVGLAVLAGHRAAGRVDRPTSSDPRGAGRAHRARPKMPEAHRWLLGADRLARDPVFWAALIAPAGLVLVGRCRAGWRPGVGPALGLLGLVELAIHGHGLLLVSPVDRWVGPDPIGRALVVSHVMEDWPVRIRAVDSLYDDLRAGRLGVPKTNVNDSFQIQHAADLYEHLYRLFDPDPFDLGRPMDAAVTARRRSIRQGVLDRMAVVDLVAEREDPARPWTAVGSGRMGGRPFVVRRNETAMPRVYLVPRVVLAPDDEFIVDRFPEVDPHQAVLMDRDPLAGVGPGRQPFRAVRWHAAAPDRLALRVETTAPGLLVVADTWMPGWSATVDGRTVPVLRGNHAQRVVPLPEPGDHAIVLTYRPPGFSAGLALTAGSALAWLALMAGVGVRRGRLRPRHAAGTDPAPPPR